jgi:hypothetical protein
MANDECGKTIDTGTIDQGSTVYIVYIYTSIPYIYLFIIQKKIYKRFACLVFGTVHSDRTLVVLLHNTLVPVVPLSVILSALSHIIYSMYANMSESNIMAYVNNFFASFKLVYYVSFLINTDCI